MTGPVDERTGDRMEVEKMDERLANEEDALATKAGEMLAPAYRAVEWEWAGGIPGGAGVPSEARIATHARRLLRDAKVGHSLACGGLVAERFMEDGEERVSLSLHIGTADGAGRQL